MKLPDATVRAALRLANPAQRFTWAAQQLYAACFPSPAVIAVPTNDVPAKPLANRGAILPLNLLTSEMISNLGATEYSAKFYIPLNYAQYSRGGRLSRSMGELSTDAVLPYVGLLPAGDPIPDNSLALTVEQYLFEQVSLLMAEAANPGYSEKNHITLNVVQAYPPNPATPLLIPCVELIGTVVRTGQEGNNRYSDITGVSVG